MTRLAIVIFCLLVVATADAEEFVLEGQITFQTQAPTAEYIRHGKKSDPGYYVEWRLPDGRSVAAQSFTDLYRKMGGSGQISGPTGIKFINLVGGEGWQLSDYDEGDDFVAFRFAPGPSGWEYGQLFRSSSGYTVWQTDGDTIIDDLAAVDAIRLMDVLESQGWELVTRHQKLGRDCKMGWNDAGMPLYTCTPNLKPDSSVYFFRRNTHGRSTDNPDQTPSPRARASASASLYIPFE